MTEKQYLNIDEASQYLQSLGIPISKSSLQMKRNARLENPDDDISKIGPSFHRFGTRKIRYTKASLDQWITLCNTETPETPEASSVASTDKPAEETPVQTTTTVTPDF